MTASLELIREYLKDVSAQWKTGQATEHSYRPALKALLEGLLPKVIVINEPQHIACGAPGYILRDRRTVLHLGFIEAKDIGDGDLDGHSAHREQFDRYKNSLETLCFTDYLDFHFYESGEFKDKVRIAEICGDRLVPADEPALEKFVGMIEHFGAANFKEHLREFRTRFQRFWGCAYASLSTNTFLNTPIFCYNSCN